MKKYLTILILFFSFTASAQIIYTPMSAGGYQMKYLKVDSGFALPFRDTTIGRGVDRSGLMVINYADSLPYYYNGRFWKPVYVDSTGVIELINGKVDSVTVNGNNIFYWVAGLGYGVQLNKLDSIHVSADSIFTCIAGNCTFQYLTTAGTGTVTSIMAGFGLTGDTITTTGTIAVDTSVFHTSNWNNAAYAPIVHFHSASDIISGTLPIARGGTGLSGIGGAGQSLRVASSGSALEYYTPPDVSGKVNYTDSGSIYVTPTQLSLSHTDSTAYHTASLNSDSTQLSLTRANGTKDTIPLPFVKKTDTTVIKVHYPVWAFTSDSLGLRTDSMPKLEYAIAGRDTSTWDNQTLIDKQFLQDRISAITATGITRTELQDTAAAIRGSMGNGSVLSVIGNPSNLVDNTDPANPVIQQDASKLDKSDSTIANRVTANTTNIASNTTAIAGKQNTITLTTTGTSGAATLSGSTLNIPQYTGGGGSSVSVTEQKNYYQGGDFWWNHGLDLSTGAITSDSLWDITDYIPIEGSTSITVSLTDSTSFAVGGWTYDSSLNPISAIRSAGSIGTLLTTYTFTTPTNARYLIMYTRAHVGPEHGDSSISRLLRIQSTNPITYNAPITPEQFTGTSDIQRIQKAVNFARWTSSGVTLTGSYQLDSAIILSSGSTLILNNAKIYMKYGMHDNMIRNEAVASHIFNRGNRKIKILGYGSAIMRGSTEAWGSSYPSGVNGQYWRANAILMANVEDLDISGITFKSLNASAIVPEQCREVHINHITFDNGGGEHLNQGGIILGRGDYNFEINNIKGVTQDDIIAVQNIPNYKGDSLYVLGTTINYMPYVKNLDVYGINIRNVDRGYSNRLGTGGLGQKLYGSRIRVIAADSGKVYNVSIDGVSGSQEIYIQVPINTYGVMNKSNVYNLTVSNTGQAPVYVERPITNSSFINVANFDTSGVYQSVVLPDSSLNIYRKYYNSAPVFIDSVYGGTEYIHNSSGLTISTGLTNTGGVITNDLSTGKSGGGTIKGGSAANENITIVPNAYTVSDNGKIYFGRAQTNYYDVANGIWIFTTPPSSTFANFQLKSTSGTITDNVGMQFNGRAYVGWDGSYTATKIGGTSSKVIIANSVTPGAGRMATFDNGNMSLGSITAPNSNLQITSLATGYVAKSTSYTATISDYTIEVTTTGQTITLPTAVGVTGRIYIIKLTASGSSTVATTSSQTIDGSTTYSLSAQNKYVSVQSNGANWVIIGNN